MAINTALIIPRESLSATFCLFITWTVWSVTPLSWTYLLLSLLPPRLSTILPSHLTDLLSHSAHLPPTLHRFLLGYTTIEAGFSLYYLYLAHTVQRRRPSPLHSRPYLLEIFRRSLGYGLEEAVSAAQPVPPNGEGLLAPPLRKRSKKQGRDEALDEDFPQLPYDDPRAADFRQMQLGWFRGVPFETIKRGNVLEWLCWACYGMRYDEVLAEARDLAPPPSAAGMSTSEDATTDDASAVAQHPQLEGIGPTKLDFLRHLCHLLERRGGGPFPEGYNAQIKPVLLTIDRARIVGRPLVLYVVVWLLGSYIMSIPLRNGFRRASQRLPHGRRFNYLVRIPKGWTPEDTRRVEDGSRDNRPLLFLHGLGMGLAQYASFIAHLSTSPTFSHRPIVILEQPHISMSFFSRDHLRPPSSRSTVAAIRAIVAKWKLGGDGLTVLSHSNGTIVHAWLMKAAPELVKRSCFVDPVTFCLFEPFVAYQFLYRPPKSGIEILMRYFVGTELGVAHMLHRHFNWTDNILWARHDAHLHDPKQTFIFLAEKDSILNADRVRSYLRANGVFDAEEGGNLMVERGAAHGETMVGGAEALGRVERFLRGQPVLLPSRDTTPTPIPTPVPSTPLAVPRSLQVPMAVR